MATKRSYYIAGECFDRFLLPSEEPERFEGNPDELFDIDVPENLFDQGFIRRRVSLSRMLGCHDGSDDLKVLLAKVASCDEVVLVDDYRGVRGYVVRGFVRKRCLQCLELLRQYAPESRLLLATDFEGKGPRGQVA